MFIKRLEGFPNMLLSLIRDTYKQVLSPGSIDRMVATISRDGSVKVFINPECKQEAYITDPRVFHAGEAVYYDEIVDIRRVVYPGVDIPKDAGIVVLFSVGWRRGLFYDFGVFGPNADDREYDISLLLGGYYSYLAFRNFFELSEDNWKALFDQHWFPFISLSRDLVRKIIEVAKRGGEVDDLLPDIRAELDLMLPILFKRWRDMAVFKPHIDFLNEAYEQYKQGRHISCLSVLFPRIEGVLRTFQQSIGCPTKCKQSDLAKAVVSSSINNKRSIFSPLLPVRFNKYLENCFFADFDPTAVMHRLSRNSLGHGVADREAYNLKGSVLGFLILSQLDLTLRE